MDDALEHVENGDTGGETGEYLDVVVAAEILKVEVSALQTDSKFMLPVLESEYPGV